MNKWFAECVPCRWQETHDDQDSALRAAETHVLEHHRELFTLPADQRSRKMADAKIAHVQLRDEQAIGAGMSAGVESSAVVAAPEFIDEELAREEHTLVEHQKWVADLRAKKTAEKEGKV